METEMKPNLVAQRMRMPNLLDHYSFREAANYDLARFNHSRVFFDKDIGDFRYSNPRFIRSQEHAYGVHLIEPYGGVTVCLRFPSDWQERYSYPPEPKTKIAAVGGVSICSLEDNFTKKVGRDKALGRSRAVTNPREIRDVMEWRTRSIPEFITSSLAILAKEHDDFSLEHENPSILSLPLIVVGCPSFRVFKQRTTSHRCSLPWHSTPLDASIHSTTYMVDTLVKDKISFDYNVMFVNLENFHRGNFNPVQNDYTQNFIFFHKPG